MLDIADTLPIIASYCSGKNGGRFDRSSPIIMEPFIRHTGLVVPMDRNDVDTDQIIPKQFLKRTDRTGFGSVAFYDWRFLNDGTSLNSGFILNKPEYQGADILLTRKNFGCGSSREHAPWALIGFGFRVIIAASFADIFYNNSFKNGLLLIRLPEQKIADLFEYESKNVPLRLAVDLEKKTLAACNASGSQHLQMSFDIEEFLRQRLLCGLDEIGMTLQSEAKIAAYEKMQGII
ncbi:MAG: 3-isopropylmalate dehydratase small subunit [Planctomycetaceae bacterium]|jgi:3-isopropylmalate/(R)-2-methylmalate dehydratase small subunit|nr:3-isopropylmalate dehydratase small subunit [Planctomycetaceae bacterium]